MKEKISNDLSYIKAGYRSDKWKWVLSLPVVSGGGAPVSSLKEYKTPDSCGSSVKGASPDIVINEKSITENSDHPDTADLLVKNNGPNCFLSSSKPFSEDQLTKEQIMKTFGMDKCPKALPCQKKMFKQSLVPSRFGEWNRKRKNSSYRSTSRPQQTSWAPEYSKYMLD
ncbi:hypothetical protein OTU49_007400 [Cherax quadricarinatus]|uniref:Uncharacterized protein n=1 Tax=Cherax quadricarinatus TaxID=27406 RepID=A0AAW0WVX7_CHEQU